MKKIVLLRHGESAWNKENRFTGWTDVDLTEKGVAEALKAGELLAEKGFRFQKAYTSGREVMAAERKALRSVARAEQSRDRRQVWRRAGIGVASQLRHRPSRAGGRRPAQPTF